MQSVSAELAAAILDLDERPQPIVRLRVDFDRSGSYTDLAVKDLSADVVSVSYARELLTDLPPEAKLFAGAASAEATITLAHFDPAGDPAKHGAWYYSGLNPSSPLVSYKRKSAPARLELGFVTANGPEYVTVLEGYVRSLSTTSGGRVAVMRVTDRSESMRRLVTVPLVVADGATEAGTGKRYNLNTIWVADYIARQCGWYASPPPRSQCMLSVTMHGSGYPEVGSAQAIFGSNQQLLGFGPSPTISTAAKWVQALQLVGSSAAEITYILDQSPGVTGTNNGDELLFECWAKLDTTAADQPLFIAYVTGAAEPYVSLFWQTSTGRLTATFSRAVADTDHATAAGPVVAPGTSNYHYYGVHVAFTSTGADVTFRYDGSSTGPEHVTTSSFTGVPNINTVGVGRGQVSAFAAGFFNGRLEAVQVTREATVGTWNNAFTPTAEIRPSTAIDSTLVATPHTTQDGWSLLQEVAAAEFATTGFTETGMFVYWPRDRWTTAPYTASQRTLTAATALKELELVEAVDQVRNRVVAKANTPFVEDNSTVWKIGRRVKMTASSSQTFFASLPNPTANIDTSMTYSVTPGAGSRYAAGTTRDGTGSQVSNLVWTVTVLGPQRVKLEVTNPNAFEIWLTADENLSVNFKGVAYVWLDGQQVLFDEGGSGGSESVDVEDATSIGDYGEQLLELPDSPWRQDNDQVTGVCQDMLALLKQALPALSDVPAVGDPRIQLADRLTLQDPGGTAVDDDYHVSRIELEFSVGEGLSMTLGLRGA